MSNNTKQAALLLLLEKTKEEFDYQCQQLSDHLTFYGETVEGTNLYEEGLINDFENVSKRQKDSLFETLSLSELNNLIGFVTRLSSTMESKNSWLSSRKWEGRPVAKLAEQPTKREKPR